MVNEPFATGDSLLHRTDPRVRLVAAAAYSVTIALCGHLMPLVSALGVSLILVFLAKLPIFLLIKRLVLVNGFILMFWLVLPWSIEGEEVFYRFGTFNIYYSGIYLSTVLTLKCNAILLSLIALVSTMSLVTLGQAMSKLKIPSRFVHLLMLTYRYVFVIEQEYARIIRAVKIRGFIPRTSLHTYKTYAYVVGMLFVRASERADRVYAAMLCRGFKGRFYSLNEFSFSLQSRVFAVVIMVILAGIGYLEVMFHG